MAKEADIELVKINTDNANAVFPLTDEQISALLDKHGSVAYVSYKICLLKTRNDTVKLGPISLQGDANYWKQLAQFYYDEYKQEQQAQEIEKSSGSTIFMRRADGT